jgi:hypothetical protein
MLSKLQVEGPKVSMHQHVEHIVVRFKTLAFVLAPSEAANEYL